MGFGEWIIVSIRCVFGFIPFWCNGVLDYLKNILNIGFILMYLCPADGYSTVCCRFAKPCLTVAGVVELLIKSGRQIDAVRFIHASSLLKVFLLSSCAPPEDVLERFEEKFPREGWEPWWCCWWTGMPAYTE